MLAEKRFKVAACMQAAAQQQPGYLHGPASSYAGILSKAREIQPAQDRMHFQSSIAGGHQGRDQRARRRAGAMLPAIAPGLSHAQCSYMGDSAHSAAFKDRVSILDRKRCFLVWGHGFSPFEFFL